MNILKLLNSFLCSMLMSNIILTAVGTTTSADITKQVDAFYDKTLIQPLKSARIYAKYGQKRNVKDSDTVRFNKYPLLPTNVVSLVEGVHPLPQKLSNSTFTATVSLYGGYIELTEECDIYNIDPIVAIAQERISWQGVESVDEITRDIIHGGTNVLYAGSVAGRANVISSIAIADLRKLSRSMMVNKVPFFKPKISSGTGVGTQPINNAWMMFISPEVLFDLEALAGFRNVSTYPQGSVEENEVGAFGYFRMISTPNAPVVIGGGAAVSTSGLASDGTNVNVHKCLAIGSDAYGTVEIDGGMKTIRKDKSAEGGPLELCSTVGWKIRYTSVILDDDRMYRYECGVTA